MSASTEKFDVGDIICLNRIGVEDFQLAMTKNKLNEDDQKFIQFEYWEISSVDDSERDIISNRYYLKPLNYFGKPELTRFCVWVNKHFDKIGTIKDKAIPVPAYVFKAIEKDLKDGD